MVAAWQSRAITVTKDSEQEKQTPRSRAAGII
jgi:hypothetical protein